MDLFAEIRSVWERSRRFRLRFGTLAGLRLWWAARRSYKAPVGTLFELAVPGLPASVSLRAGTCDIGVLEQVLCDRETEFELDAAPSLIIDGGANIGIFSLLMAARYPDCRIIAIEAEEENHQVLCRNARKFPNITPMHCALWSRAGYVRIANPTGQPNAFQVVQAEQHEADAIRAVSVGALIESLGATEISLLKLDIEGAELEVLQDADAPGWLAVTRTMAVELHDRMKPGCSAALDSLLSTVRNRRERVGEYHLVRLAHD